jgi:hypothetical protein
MANETESWCQLRETQGVALLRGLHGSQGRRALPSSVCSHLVDRGARGRHAECCHGVLWQWGGVARGVRRSFLEGFLSSGQRKVGAWRGRGCWRGQMGRAGGLG